MSITQLEWRDQLLMFGLLLAIICIAVGWWIGCRERTRLKRLMAAEFRTLASLAQNKSLPEKLSEICLLIEDQIPHVMCSVMLVDEDQATLQAISAPSLPSDFSSALQHLPIADGVGACGTAAYTKQPVLVADMTHDARFQAFRELIQRFQLRACWSFPVLSTTGSHVIGTFAVYSKLPSEPTTEQITVIQRCRDIVALVIDQHRDRVQRERSEQRHRSLFSYNPEAVFTLDLEGRFVSVNRAGEGLTGYDEQSMLGQHYELVVAAADRARTMTHFKAAKAGKPQRYEVTIHNREGEAKIVDVTNMPIVIDGEITGVHGVAKDVTAQRRNESRLKLLERSVESSTNGVVICDANLPDYPIIYINKAFKAITGYTDETEVIGREFNFLQGTDRDNAASRKVREALLSRTEVRVVIRNYRKDGSLFWNDLLVSPVRDGDRVTHFVGLQSDITERVEREQELRFLARHDVLTGLPNRNALEARLNERLLQDKQTNAYVLFIDLDGFKPINDSLGHAVGDRVLKETAERLRQQLTDNDLLARFGGDEFVAVIYSATTSVDATLLIARLLAVFHQPYRFDDLEVSLSATIGVADSRLPFERPAELIQRADIAMYEAKRRGGSAWYWYSADLDEGMQQQVALRTQLQEAIQQQQFELFYQPIVDNDGRPRAVEALVRWRHPQQGYISPAEFIPLAEKTGQIIAIADWVFEQACSDCAELLATGLQSVSVNFSPMQFYRDDFLEKVEATMQRYQVKPKQLVVEITENVFIRDSERMIELLHGLRALGLKIAIDDFGTGFASLSYLNQLPVDGVKIDKSFIHNVHKNPRNAAITRGVLLIAEELGVRTIAEGVETIEEQEYLVTHGCEMLQGYLHCRPQPLVDVVQWLAKQR
ncbi:EAL domain-containing protein [Pseudidiomarina sediminum]|uniref:EAL domain-containing protein n=1 Tax=Pseudidiomarina sediminum TaxID=431675 RepID=UPI001C98C286|nr:EAL domain-containing protein [Pseudidiomarina sediminum]MBY6064463.1 EAL domain-containing protein [Pseudidiomarina sediminum]